jgi:hypothetical protein
MFSIRGVTFSPFGCKLLSVRSRPFKFALLILLVFQLALGLQVQGVHASDMYAGASHAGAGHIGAAGHAGAAAGHVGTGRAVVPPHVDCPMHAGTDKQAPMGTHGCCRASACQCHCVNPPAAVELPALANIATSVAVPSLADAQFVAPRIDEFLRPPIA